MSKLAAFLSLTVFILPWTVHALSLDNLESRARDRNPQLREARQAWKTLDAQVISAGAWPDPTFSYIDERFPSGTAGVEAEAIRHYRVEQPVQFPGKLSREAEMKRHEALIAKNEYSALELEILGQVQEMAYQLYLTDRSTQLAQQSVDVLQSALRTSQARLAGGQTSAADVFMAQTELRRMEGLAFGQRQARVLAQIQLNSLLDQPTETPLDSVTPPPFKDLPQSLQDLLLLATAHSPWIQYGDHQTHHSETMLARSRLDYAPDFGLIAEREETSSGPAGRQLGVTVTFPLWVKRPWGNVKAAQEHLLETQARADERAAMVRRMVHMEFTEVHTHLIQAERYRDGIIPASESTLRVVRQQYASGQTDFLRFLEAFRAWLNAELDYENEIYHYAEHKAQLERWVGVALPPDEKGAVR
jgi:cobalt-zinc-cadmium efflux system outer membrane protein